MSETGTGARRYRRGLLSGRGAFTLIELLVVIAIIALLVSILLPLSIPKIPSAPKKVAEWVWP